MRVLSKANVPAKSEDVVYHRMELSVADGSVSRVRQDVRVNCFVDCR